MAKSSTTEEVIIIGVDFGTTYDTWSSHLWKQKTDQTCTGTPGLPGPIHASLRTSKSSQIGIQSSRIAQTKRKLPVFSSSVSGGKTNGDTR